jgi:hypothetical protein
MPVPSSRPGLLPLTLRLSVRAESLSKFFTVTRALSPGASEWQEPGGRLSPGPAQARAESTVTRRWPGTGIRVMIFTVKLPALCRHHDPGSHGCPQAACQCGRVTCPGPRPGRRAAAAAARASFKPDLPVGPGHGPVAVTVTVTPARVASRHGG